MSTLSPSFYDVNQSGEIVSRLTADTTQIKAAVGSSASVALRNLVLFVGAGASLDEPSGLPDFANLVRDVGARANRANASGASR